YYVLVGEAPVLVHNSGCDPIDLGNGLYQHPDGSIRTANGKFASTTGQRVGGLAERQAWDQLELDGFVVVRRPIAVRGNNGQLRIYDGAIDLGGGNYLGIEIKSGSATL